MVNSFVFWLQYPFIRYLFLFITGILAGNYFPMLGNFRETAIVFLLVILFAALFFRKNFLKSICYFMIWFVSGIISVPVQNPIRFPEGIRFLGEVEECDRTKNGGMKAFLQIHGVCLKGEWENYKAGVQIFFKSKYSPELSPGDIVQLRSSLLINESDSFPGAFDYALWLKRKGILFRSYVGEGDIEILKRKGVYISALRGRWERYASAKFENLLISENAGLAKALLLGSKSSLSENIKTNYSGAGLMHVLAVSGLHTGIIYLIANLMLYIIIPRKGLRSFIVLLLVWLFCLATGAGPSVLRASIMISVVVIGNMLGRKINVLNAIAFSAWVLLLFDSYLIYDVGFQLSYLAVTGIVLMYPHLRKLLYFKNKFLNRLWELIALSISAQISTGALSIFYFHQFPAYFLLSNFLVPLIPFLIGSGLVSLLPEGIYLDEIGGFVLDNGLKLMNTLAAIITSLPGAVIENAYIGKLDVIIWYVMIAFLYLWLVKKSFKGFVLFILCVYGLMFLSFFEPDEEALLIYRSGNEYSVDLTGGKYSGRIDFGKWDNEVFSREEVLKYHNGFHPVKVEHIDEGESKMVFWRGRRILFLKGKKYPALEKIKRDTLIHLSELPERSLIVF